MRSTTVSVLASIVAVAFSQIALAQNFNRITTLPNYVNNTDIGQETVSEIIAATDNGNTIVYTDSPLGQIGLFDITNTNFPIYGGKFSVGGSPTSVAVLGNELALVGVDTSTSFTSPSGFLAVIDISAPPTTLVATIDLDGQPDSVAISPDGHYAAVVIENERDEFVCVGGSSDAALVPEDAEAPGDITEDECEAGGGEVGVIPQNGPDTAIGNPAGYLAVIDLSDPDPAKWTRSDVALTGLANFAPTDPEPEFVDINADNHAVVTLQENNHIVIVNLADGSIVNHFSAGTVSLTEVDANEDGLILLGDALDDIPREPDAATWVTLTDGYAIASANEGDLNGGSRGMTLFGADGAVIFDTAANVEHQTVRHGHYPEDRSENKGAEPEAVEYGIFGDTGYLFLGSERGSFINVYRVDPDTGIPEFAQLLPAPFGPEGVLAIPSRKLLLASGENDDPSFGVRSTVMIYEMQDADATYPQIVSDDLDGLPIGWSALSGMVATSEDELLAVWDSYYSESRIFSIDVTQTPALITGTMIISGGSGNYDPEGITIAPDGTYWIASEGNASGERPNLLVQTDALGTVLQEVGLPNRVEQCRTRSESTGTLGSGFEGLTVARGPLPGITAFRGARDRYLLLVAQQRGWNYTTRGCALADDDPFDLNGDEPFVTRIWAYDVKRNKWKSVLYLLEQVPENASWVGLSEITRVEGGFIVIERDNRTGDLAELKTLVWFPDEAMADGIVMRAEKRVYDLLPDLYSTNGWITDKPEGVAVTPEGQLYLVTDNDGVEDWSGETWFLRLGNVTALFE